MAFASWRLRVRLSWGAGRHCVRCVQVTRLARRRRDGTQNVGVTSPASWLPRVTSTVTCRAESVAKSAS